MKSSNLDYAADELARLTFVFRIFAVLLSILSLADAAQRVPGVVLGLVVAALLSFAALRWWSRMEQTVRRHPAIFAVDVALSCSLLSVAGPSSPFFVYTLATAMLAGILYGHFGAAFFATSLFAGYALANDIWAIDGSFMARVGLPSLYFVMGGGAAHIAVTYRRLAEAAALEAVSQERSRLAREIHDSVAKTVVGLSLQASALRKRLGDDGSPHLPLVDSLTRMAEQASRESREALVALREVSGGASVADAIVAVIADVEAETSVVVRTRNLRHAHIKSPMVRFEVARIVGEAVRNAAAHAGTGFVDVEATATDDAVDVIVSDAGRGFDPQLARRQAVAEAHFGLIGMEERAKHFGGSIHIDSASGVGTKVAIRVPKAASTKPAASRGHGQVVPT